MRIDPLGVALSALTRFAGSSTAERFGLRKPAERAATSVVRTGFRAATTAARAFRSAGRLLEPERPGTPVRSSDLFDPSPTEDQKMIQEPLQQFADGEVRGVAAEADEACETPKSLRDSANAFGIAAMAVPEKLGGAGGDRSPTTGVLVAEELARGDMGIATAILAPIGVANALSLWGTAEQQERYLPPFTEESAFAAALAIAEPAPRFDPLRLSTRATRTGDTFTIRGTKALVPLAAEAEIFLVAADLEGVGPSVFVVERGTEGLSVEPKPAMGIRAASLGHVMLEDVRVSVAEWLGNGHVPYEELIDLCRLGACALAVGSGQAVLDYVIPYVNERIAFGEPVSHRQSVAFAVSDVAIELESMRLLTRRAASRAEQGLSFHREAHLARVLCAEKAVQIGSTGVQLLGGHGFVKEHPVERWYRDLRATGILEGGVLV